MTAIWPDGTAENIPNNIPEEARKLLEFARWYESLSEQNQNRLKKELEYETTRIP